MKSHKKITNNKSAAELRKISCRIKRNKINEADLTAIRGERNRMKSHKKITNNKCENFVNANCSYNCPNASLEYACDRWDLDPSDFGEEFIECKDCQYDDDNCTCEDCYVNGAKEFCKKGV